MQEVLPKLEAALKQSVEHLKSNLSKIRSGRAHSSMLDSVKVEVYGQEMPLVAVGSVTAPEAQLLQITPYDPNSLQAIASAIRNDQTLGLNPVDDGRVIRITLPPLTAERRQELAKQVAEKVEETMIAMRNARHEALKSAEEVKKTAGENEFNRLQKQIDETMERYKKQAEEIAEQKKQELTAL